MKKNSGNKIRLGLFVTLAALLFLAGTYLIGQKRHLFGTTFRARTVFRDVGGLQVGNNVRFSGINIGTVDDIEIISDTSVRVDLVLDEQTRKFIKKDARASVGSEGLMGNKVVSIYPGSPGGGPIRDGDFIRAATPVNLDDILVKLKVTSDNAADITTNLSDIVYNIRNGRGAVGKLFMDSAFAENLDQTLTNIKQGAGGFKKNMEAAQHSFLLRGFLRKKDKDKQKDDKPKEDKGK